MIELKEKDYKQLNTLGIDQSNLETQLALFHKGVKPIELTRAARVKAGIVQILEKRQIQYIESFNQRSSSLNATRFVPASGAASRMFKAFYQFLDDGKKNEEIITFSKKSYLFPFYNKIKCNEEEDLGCSIDKMLNTLKLAELPKALIPFHKYEEEVRTAFEEHLVEAAMVIGDSTTVNLHFTISKAHKTKFEEILQKKLAYYTTKLNSKFDITFSYQSQSTDTVAVNSDNEPIRNDDDSLLFRPGGHGSLIQNLNTLDSDLIFIKNIDNIQPDHLKLETVKYKKVLGGFLLSIVEDINGFLNTIDEPQGNLDKIQSFAEDTLHITLPDNFNELSDAKKKELLFSKLNRPIRVCGMVKNVGEPGGGPFWVKNSSGDISAQIVESSQIDLGNSSQEAIFQKSTHFNPVDIICWVKDYKGDKFNLPDYTDTETSFITEKSQSGQTFKVLEHPGLWNGAMADWITIFVEVPLSTFSPVKTITDLLRPEHQPA